MFYINNETFGAGLSDRLVRSQEFRAFDKKWYDVCGTEKIHNPQTRFIHFYCNISMKSQRKNDDYSLFYDGTSLCSDNTSSLYVIFSLYSAYNPKLFQGLGGGGGNM